MSSTSIKVIHFEQAYFHPGAAAMWTVVLSSHANVPVQAELSAHISYLDTSLAVITKPVVFSDGDQEISFEWLSPKQTPRGYGLDITLKLADGTVLAQKSSGFDVLDKWTQMPRYGFLTDYFPGRTDAAQTLQELADFHVNGLQYYDWMYRHEQFLTTQDPYIDLLGRTLSIKTVNNLIDESHKHGIAAMPYTAIYGASMEFFNKHKDWGLYYANGNPVYLGDFIGYMDPRPDSAWMKHLLAEFKDVLQNTKFDGIHLDQYGDPKEGYDVNGKPFDLGQAIAESITETHAVVDQYRSDGAVVFNCVTNWPVELASKANEDFIYIEVWAPYTSFSDLHNLITYAQSLGTGKPVVLAAYVHPGSSSNPFLMDAIIFASGGGHIELGENSGYLVEAYFPNYDKLTIEQTQKMQNYYDFAVRYQNLIGPSTTEATGKWVSHIQSSGLKVGFNQGSDAFALARESDGALAISLINLTDIQSDKWNEPAQFPKQVNNVTLTIDGFDKKVKKVFLTSPDEGVFELSSIEFKQQGDQVTTVIPALKIWDLLVFEY